MEPTVQQARKLEPRGFQIIGAFKLASAVLLFAAGVGIFRLIDKDLGKTLEHYILMLRLDPENRLLHTLISRISGIDRHQLQLIGVGTFLYALLHVIEGTGLLLRRRWAGYVTVVLTGSLLPVEIYEIIHRTTVLKISVLTVNVAIVIYLIAKLREEAKEPTSSVDPLPDEPRAS